MQRNGSSRASIESKFVTNTIYCDSVVSCLIKYFISHLTFTTNAKLVIWDADSDDFPINHKPSRHFDQPCHIGSDIRKKSTDQNSDQRKLGPKRLGPDGIRTKTTQTNSESTRTRFQTTTSNSDHFTMF